MLNQAQTMTTKKGGEGEIIEHNMTQKKGKSITYKIELPNFQAI